MRSNSRSWNKTEWRSIGWCILLPLISSAYLQACVEFNRGHYSESLELYKVSCLLISAEQVIYKDTLLYSILDGDQLVRFLDYLTYLENAIISSQFDDASGLVTWICEQRALQVYPDCPAAVRLGIGLCRYQLKQYRKAQQAFERVLQASDISFLIPLNSCKLTCFMLM